jgi:hypothetical protein
VAVKEPKAPRILGEAHSLTYDIESIKQIKFNASNQI